MNFRNSLYTLVNNGSGNIFYLVFVRLVLDGIAGIKFLFELKPKHTLAIIKAHFTFYGHLNTLLKQRKSLKKRTKYYSQKSIVWSYFIAKKRYFKSL